jgi:hypothetical protein
VKKDENDQPGKDTAKSHLKNMNDRCAEPMWLIWIPAATK